MKKIIAFLLCSLLCVCALSFAVVGNAKQLSESTSDIAEEFDDKFLKEADFYEDAEGNFVFTKTSKENSVLTRSGAGANEYISDCVVLVGETEEVKKEIEEDIYKLKSGISPLSSGGNNYAYAWDGSGASKIYTRVYYTVSTISGNDYYEITKVTGGFTGGSGTSGAVVGSGVTVRSQSLSIGQTGRSANEGMKTGQKRYINLSTSSRSWTQTVPSSWVAVNGDITPCLVGATLTVYFGRGDSTWSATVKNNIIENTLS